jgi:hypothetical protein
VGGHSQGQGLEYPLRDFQRPPRLSVHSSIQEIEDGPAAFYSLRQHYLGVNNVNNMATKLEAEFEAPETRRWNFEKYVGTHVELYNTAQDLVAYGYAGIDNTSRVRKLLNGIKTDTLDAVRNQVMSDQALASDFDRVVNLFKDFLVQKKALFKTDKDIVGIASATTSKQGGKRKWSQSQDTRNTRKKTTRVSAVDVQDRYYTPQEYSQLNPDQKKALHEMRKKRSKTAVVSGQVEKETVSVKEEDSESQSSPNVTNRNNPALRQKGVKKSN